MTGRRTFLRHVATVLLSLASLLIARPSRVAASLWTTRRARSEDLAALIDLFNRHLEDARCAYPERIKPWTEGRASAFLALHKATIIVERDGVPLGFGGLIDYLDPTTDAQIEPGATADVYVVALDFDALGADTVIAAKHLAARMGRELLAMGCPACRILLPPAPVLDRQDWLERHWRTERQYHVDGELRGVEVEIDVAGGLAELEREGF